MKEPILIVPLLKTMDVGYTNPPTGQDVVRTASVEGHPKDQAGPTKKKKRRSAGNTSREASAKS